MDTYRISFSILVLVVSQYIYFYSNLYTNHNIGTVGLEKHPQLSPTHAAVFQLMKTLPYRTYQFTLFCDNLFGNPKLFSLLRSLGIGACSTARRQVTKPVFGDIDDWKVAWGTLRSAVVAAFSDKDKLYTPTLVSV
jgi:hypothetical protein